MSTCTACSDILLYSGGTSYFLRSKQIFIQIKKYKKVGRKKKVLYGIVFKEYFTVFPKELRPLMEKKYTRKGIFGPRIKST